MSEPFKTAASVLILAPMQSRRTVASAFGSLDGLFGSALALRRDGFFVSFESVSLRLFSIRASRAFTASNSDVVTVYRPRARENTHDLVLQCRIRSGVAGWSLNALASAPGLRFSSADSFSKK